MATWNKSWGVNSVRGCVRMNIIAFVKKKSSKIVIVQQYWKIFENNHTTLDCKKEHKDEAYALTVE